MTEDGLSWLVWDLERRLSVYFDVVQSCREAAAALEDGDPVAAFELLVAALDSLDEWERPIE